MKLLLFCSLSHPLTAQHLTVSASVQPSVVGLNHQFVLNVEVSGNPQQAGQPELPEMGRFSRFISSGSSQRFEFINGRASSSVTYQYSFLATREGKFEIGPITLRDGGKEYKTNPVVITVRKSPPRSSGSGSPNQHPPGLRMDRRDSSRSAVAEDELFLEVSADKSRVYQGEPVIVEYKIYTLVNVTSFSVVTPPGTAGFWAEDFELPRSPVPRNEARQGRLYTVATLKKMALFPTSPGKKTVDPMVLDCEVRVLRPSRRDTTDIDSFFRNRSLFGAGRFPMRVVSDPLEVEVLPFPPEGRPADFTGISGRLRISSSLDRPRVRTNGAVTLKVRISGEGNLNMLSEPQIDFPSQFEVYPPKVNGKTQWQGDRITGWKEFEYVLIPRAPGIHTIPPVSMSYFDPGSRSYRRVRSAEIRLEAEGEATQAMAGRSRGQIRQLAQDIRFIKTDLPSFRHLGQAFYQKLAFWLVTLLPLAALAGALGFRRHLDRMEGDLAYARKRRAGRLAKKRLARARSLLDPAKQQEFYAEAGGALLGFLGDKLNIAEAALISDQARSRLQEKGASEQLIDDYLSCLDTCDRQRFAPSESSRQEMSDFLQRAGQAMTQLDREVR